MTVDKDARIAELERKLAEQQAVHLVFCKTHLGGEKYYKFHGHAPQEELNNLLAEEREACAEFARVSRQLRREGKHEQETASVVGSASTNEGAGRSEPENSGRDMGGF